MSWFDPIKNALEVVVTDIHNIFAPGGGGFTQANFVKLGLDIESGVAVDVQQVQIGLKAVAIGIQQAIPLAQRAIAEAQLVAVAYPAVEPFIVEIQVGLTAAQALDQLLLNSSSQPANTIPDGITVISNLASSVSTWAKNAIAAVKAAK